MRSKTILCAALAFMAAEFSIGCSGGMAQLPIEHLTDKIVDDAIKPAIAKAMNETVANTFQIQGGLQAVNPKYCLDFEGKWVVGIEGRVTVGVEGFAGQVQGATQGANPNNSGGAAVEPPALRAYPAEPGTSPAPPATSTPTPAALVPGAPPTGGAPAESPAAPSGRPPGTPM